MKLVTPPPESSALTILEKLNQHLTPVRARALCGALERAIAKAREEAMQGQEAEWPALFAGLLPLKVRVELSNLDDPDIECRIAKAGGRGVTFQLLIIGSLYCGPSNTSGPKAQPRSAVYWKVLHSSEVIQLADCEDTVQPMSSDVICTLHWGYNFKEGLPLAYDFLRLSAFRAGGKKYEDGVNLYDIASRSKKPIAVIKKPEPQVALFEDIPVPPARRQRGQPKPADVPAEKENKTS